MGGVWAGTPSDQVVAYLNSGLVQTGCQEAAEFGVLAGYPMVDVKVTLTDGAYHELDSTELAFKIAGSMAFKKAYGSAEPVRGLGALRVPAAGSAIGLA